MTNDELLTELQALLGDDLRALAAYDGGEINDYYVYEELEALLSGEDIENI
ncbi:MAG: hypothetical protein U5K28_10665 [Halobacteriales archaeon]|nr:hypothetical protein [Halobacteriales archaeon]